MKIEQCQLILDEINKDRKRHDDGLSERNGAFEYHLLMLHYLNRLTLQYKEIMTQLENRKESKK